MLTLTNTYFFNLTVYVLHAVEMVRKWWHAKKLKKPYDKLNYTKFSCKASIEWEINLPSSTSQPIFN